MAKHAIMNTKINNQELNKTKQLKTLIWVDSKETLINYVPKDELESIYSDVCLDLFPPKNIEEFYGVNVTAKGRESFEIFKYLIKNKIDSISLDPVNFKRGHPFLKYTDEIRKFPFSALKIEYWIGTLEKIRVIGSEDTFHTIMSTDSIRNKLNEKIKTIN
jgi:hypothetical protein